jgi:LysM repeat protein
VAKKGDTYEKLAKLFAVSARNLRRFNDVDRKAQLEEGDIVYIERKLPSWMGEELLHTVKDGETLHDISQLYGVRLKSLSKQNTMRSNAPLTVGRTIRIQKW